VKYVLDTTLISALMRAEPAASVRLTAERPVDVGLLPQPAIAEVSLRAFAPSDFSAKARSQPRASRFCSARWRGWIGPTT